MGAFCTECQACALEVQLVVAERTRVLTADCRPWQARIVPWVVTVGHLLQREGSVLVLFDDDGDDDFFPNYIIFDAISNRSSNAV